MRFRKIKHLEARRNKCEELRIDCPLPDFDLRNLDEHYSPIDLKKVFKNNNPLVLEIGCGKGQFACEYAKQNPDKNIIGIECVPGVLVKACEKAKEAELQNLRFLEMKAEYLSIFIEKNSVSEIYLNFSTPFPKYKQRKHRLTSPEFLKIYKQILIPNGFIVQKTDSAVLFEFSIESFSQNGFELGEVTLDLHNSRIEGNIETEYEQRFLAEGLPIYRLKASLKKSS
ncbi:MAG: tRNA (guanosine(46)-N7)-methyltransferase TrmB [Ruminococcaceae bacterium]|nr:tRNA (guanosine(46)-N7)-methyltransferase TrmB [Oscillospiraceae bacterium]